MRKVEISSLHKIRSLKPGRPLVVHIIQDLVHRPLHPPPPSPTTQPPPPPPLPPPLPPPGSGSTNLTPATNCKGCCGCCNCSSCCCYFNFCSCLSWSEPQWTTLIILTGNQLLFGSSSINERYGHVKRQTTTYSRWVVAKFIFYLKGVFVVFSCAFRAEF